MTTPGPSPSGGPQRVQGASLLGGLIVGALLMGAFAPLVGTDRGSGGSSGAQDVVGSAGDAGTGGPGNGAPGISAPGPGLPGTSPLPGSTATAAAGAGGTGGGSTSGGAGGQGGAVGPGTQKPGTGLLTASDVGVTAKAIKIGIINLNCKGCSAIGVASGEAASQRSVAAALVQDLNARGGINGRKIELVSADYDPVQDAMNGGGTERRACVELTENQKVFAVVLGGINTNACIYNEHKTPLIAERDILASDPESFNRSGGNLWTLDASAARVLINWAVQLDRQRILTKSTKWGLVLDDSTSPLLRKYFLPTLKRVGLSPTHTSTLPLDPATYSVKIAQEVPAMKAAGVSHVLFGMNFFTAKSWVREAQRNSWKPQYVVSDYGVGTDQFSGGEMSSQGSDWTGAIAVSGVKDGTIAERRKDPAVSGCLAAYERITRRTASENDLLTLGNLCATIGLFERAATKAGPNLTRRGFVQALASTGQFPMADRFGSKGSFGGRYSLGAVKWSGSNFGQTKRWTNKCPRPQASGQCFVTISPVYPLGA